MQRILNTVIFLLLSLPLLAWVNIDSTRRIQLDSIVTFMPKETKKDLYQLHAYIQENGENDEERVWMFYGYFAIHTKYDTKRCYASKALFQTPEYTINKRKGVCRDFADAFKKLCELSGIPCFNVYGRVNANLLSKLTDLAHFKLPNNRHQWNVVRLNGEWSIMDPTWGKVTSYHRYYSYNKKGEREYLGKAKIPDRTYYDAIPQNLSRSHKPYHPAFFLLQEVPTYKTSFRLDSKRKWFDHNYDYAVYLDSLAAQRIPELSHLWNDGAFAYSGNVNPVYFKSRYMNYDTRLQDKDYKPTLEEYKQHLIVIDSLAQYYKEETGINEYTADYKKIIDSLYIRKLEKKLEKQIAQK